MSKIRFNEDWFHFFHSRYDCKADVDEQYLKDFIYQYKDTQITDFCMNVNARVASYPSKVIESFSDKHLQKQQNGLAVDFTDNFTAVAYDIFVNKKLDMYKIWIDTLREINIHPWLSIRMNDCHCNFMPEHVLVSEYSYNNPKIKRVKHRTPDKSIQRVSDDEFYWDDCYDFAVDEVRNQLFALIDEALDRYDVDGLELDFTREIPCFEIGAEGKGRKIMTEYVAKIRNLLNEYEAKRSRKIELSVLVNSDPLCNYNWGLDVAEWAKQKLVNSVIALPRWQTVDTDIPVKLWKDLLSPYGVEFAAGNQILTADSTDEYGYTSTLETSIGAAAVYRSFGADFVYIYNHMDLFYNGYPKVKPWIPDEDLCTKVLVPEKLNVLFNTAGDKEKLINSKRRHFLSFHDFPIYWEEKQLKLPFVCDDKLRYKFAKINVGELPQKAAVKLLIGVKANKKLTDSDIYVKVNSKDVNYIGTWGVDDTTDSVMFEIPDYRDIVDSVVVEMTTKGDAFKVVHMEIIVEPIK